jgi:hypothetical protein
LIAYYKGNQKFGGVFSRDSIVHLNNMFYIFNLDNEDGPGTHWVVIYNCEPDKCLYFDPFGVDPPEELLELMRTTRKKIIMNSYRVQALTSKSCGVFCVYIINGLLSGKEYINILTNFDPNDYSRNERIIITL